MSEFMIGCNYWASNAGTEMWREWNEECVRRDLETLSEHGIRYMRVFPNWRDFQPVIRYRGFRGSKRELARLDGKDFENKYYLDEEMLLRFESFIKICGEFDIHLIVALLTGWMSGRLFVPPALEGVNLFTDPFALRMEERFVKGFIERFKDSGCILAWSLGNECNCMSEAKDSDTAACWTAFVSNAIRTADPERKIYSGMHSLTIDEEWKIKDQGESCDVLAVHPYPQFVPHCFRDGMTSLRTLMHSQCEARFYSDISKIPCMVEEIGTLGPMSCDEEMAAQFLKSGAYSAWINDNVGFFWWCACDQTGLSSAPYKWIMIERELGLLNADGTPKKTLKMIKEISGRIKTLGFNPKKPKTDAVCITSIGQDTWGAAYMTYILAKQAGLNIGFAHSEYDIPEANVYLLPSATGSEIIPLDNYKYLKKRVEEGATLYISNDEAVFSEFSKLCGVEVHDSMLKNETCEIAVGGETFLLERKRRYDIKEAGAKVLAYDNLGIPALTEFSYGRGRVIYLNFPLETSLLEKEDAFSENFYKLYRLIFKDVLDKKPVKIDNDNVFITYHEIDEGEIAVLFNYSDETQTAGLTYGGRNDRVTIEAYDFHILKL